MAIIYQTSAHGAGKFSVQVFDGDKLLEDANIVKDINGWRVVTLRKDGLIDSEPQHASPQDAAKWFATTLGFSD